MKCNMSKLYWLMDIKNVNWCYHAEGNANIIVKNVIHNAILRIGKEDELKTDKKAQKFLKMFSHEANCEFLNLILTPLFGKFEKYLPTIQLVKVNLEFLEKVSKAITFERPVKRKHRDIDKSSLFAQLMPHYGILRSVLKDISISVEIKPKWGYIPTSNGILPQHQVKRNICRYCLHQVTKLKAGQIKILSKYCPIELFSGCSCFVRNALKSLFLMPQNNLSITVNGSLVSNEHLYNILDSYHNKEIKSSDYILDILTEIFKNDSFAGISLKNDTNLSKRCSKIHGKLHASNCQKMGSSGILNLLKYLQHLGGLDIEDVIQIYTEQQESQNLVDIQDFMNFKSQLWKSTVNSILNKDESNCESVSALHINICQFLISQTMKDCSMVITFAKTNNSFINEDCNNSVISVNDQLYKYQIKLVDLDPYYLHNIPQNYEQDHNIVSTYVMESQGIKCCP